MSKPPYRALRIVLGFLIEKPRTARLLPSNTSQNPRPKHGECETRD
jgi:hypothetical protein